ncbi:MAG: triose-phosphate isomerase [Gemmataceae bacterium]
MSRTKFICGNWKMFTSATSGRELAKAVAVGVTSDRVRVAVCPPFPYLATIAEALAGSRVGLGAQNLYPADEGAFTGEVSPTMLKDVGCQYVIVGHSERRHILGEQDEFINRKVRAAISAGLTAILCVGETLDERQQDKTEDVLARQLVNGLKDISSADSLVIAYEPVWAIGTGVNASPEQAQDAHRFIRQIVAQKLGQTASDQIIIQYGGSAKPDNVATLLSQPDVDGALVGGASLKAELFLAIINLA